MNNLFLRFYAGIVVALALAAVLVAGSAARRTHPSTASPAELEAQAARIAEHYVELTDGNHWLMQEALRAHPVEQWDSVVARWQPHFHYPIKLRPAPEVLDSEMPAFTRRRLEAGEPAAWVRARGPASEHLLLYLPLEGSGRVLVQDLDLGPPVEVLIELFGRDLVVLLLLLGVAILALTRPIARHVTRLADAASTFGEGRLDARVNTSAPEPVAHLARCFNAMAERLQRSADEQQATLQAISHELRTPIARLHFALEASTAAIEAPDARAHLDAMVKDVGEMEALVEELLAYARLQPGAPPLEAVTLDLVDLVEGVVQELAPLSPDLSIEIDAPAPAVGIGDPRHLRRAVSNLVRNAQRHARARIVVRISAGARSVVMVDDDGPGIPPEQRARIFLPFERLDASRSRSTGGHGLGLAIVHRVMQAHAGCASAESSDLGGARLILSWPGPAETPVER
ncbi:ATP-binding protein [Polyangium jinanense]|uniref:histidine kinase n=1 Tax=Polyangium jinanense TaxID=2829994 RepID=A0A9X3X9Y3_9BACT|nr:ATP-binding protein [Polyangium jinanense]MDC3958973.1 HAMP domain-containing protein [Polyangium jinanense]MDC3986402.1 HAMP domain-containing protein [Polyangium jinanense]